MQKLIRLLAFLLLLLLLTPPLSYSYQEIGWKDLTVSMDSADDPFFGLTFEQKLNVERLVELDRKRERDELLSAADLAAESAATNALHKDGISAEEIIRKNTEFLEKLELHRNSARNEWDKQQVRIPGYILQLEFDGTKVTEFLLVPYVGACIHVPPPPPTQIVYVTIKNGYESGGVFEPVWVQGTIEVKSSKKNLYLKDGSADIEFGYSIRADSVETYSKRP